MPDNKMDKINKWWFSNVKDTVTLSTNYNLIKAVTNVSMAMFNVSIGYSRGWVTKYFCSEHSIHISPQRSGESWGMSP